MKFFITDETDPAKSEAFYSELIGIVEESIDDKILKRRIYQIEYVQDGEDFIAQVGETFEEEVGPVFAIFQTQHAYLICLHDHGVVEGEPIFVDPADVRHVVDFD